MYSKLIDNQQATLAELPAYQENFVLHQNTCEEQKLFLFRVSYLGAMDMYSDAETVADYLNTHEGWFCRCAQPMKVEPLNENGYILTVGCFSSLGYEVEPKIAIVLNPPVDGVYRMETAPIPDYHSSCYEVNYQASMKLTEQTRENKHTKRLSLNFFKEQTPTNIPPKITQVSWTMDLEVRVKLPQFLHKLSSSLVQSTGDRLLSQIIRQISPRLTYKVQQDFHTRYDLPIPPKSSLKLEKVN